MIKNYDVVRSVDELHEHFTRIYGSVIGFDIETGYHGATDIEKGSIHPETATLVGFSFTNSTDWARYVPLNHDTGENITDHQAVAVALWGLLATGQGVAHNAAFELRHLSRWFTEQLRDHPVLGEAVRASGGYFPIRSDTQVEAYLAAEHQRFGLKYLTNALFGHQMTELYDLFDNLPINRRKYLRFNTLEITPRVVEYACEDAAWCLAIHEKYYDRVNQRLLYKVEMAIVENCIPDMEDFGVLYDWETMRRTADTLREFRAHFNAEIMIELSEMIGETVAINLASPAQVSKVLFEKLGYRTTVYTEATRDLPEDQRKMSTGSIALTKLAKKYPVVKKILQWKEMTRLLGTYLDKYEKVYGYADDGRCHPNHLSAFVVTGRFSVSDPPYQGSPKKYHYDLAAARAAHERGEEPPPETCFRFNFRDCIIAPPEHYILGFDLSQAELRAIAGEAKEEALLRAFAIGEDVHRLTASLMLGYPLDEITEEQRDVGKAQPLDASILTPTGWAKMGEISPGDLVVGSDGTPVAVTGVFPQGEREIYRVTTSDGATTECCGDHLWTVRNINSKGEIWKTRSLSELMSAGLLRENKRTGYGQPKYQLPDRPIVQFVPNGELPFDPYVLGLLLGDGGFTHSWAPMFGSADRELLGAVRAEHERRGGRWASEEETGKNFWRAYLAGGERYRRSTNVIKDSLRQLGLWGVRDHSKFVPDQYLMSSPESRLAVLQGLLDSDGTVLASGAQFRVTSRRLAEAVQFIARSLGGWASIAVAQKPRTPMHVKSDPLPIWTVYLRLPDGMCPFRLARKVARWKAPRYRAPQTIVKVEHVGVKQVQCISVSAKNGLYGTDGFIYTHNTMNFALLYGMGVKSLADRLALPIGEAQSLMDKYFAGYANIATWSARQVEHGRRHGYVTSRFGRILPIWEYQHEKMYMQQKGDRACVNYPIQGAATGDFMKIAMVRAQAAIRAAGLRDKIHMVMNVHDALEFYVHSSVTPQQAIAVLADAVIFTVPGWPAMQADWHVAKKWGSPTAIEPQPDGTLLVKGEKVYDLTPAVEVDEETGEKIEAMPEVDPDALHQAAATQQPRRVVVTLPVMPTSDSWHSFIALARASVGDNVVLVVTPEGDIELPFTSGIAPDELAAVSRLLGEVDMVYAASDQDVIAVTTGMSL